MNTHIYSNGITQYSFCFPAVGPPTMQISITGRAYLSNSISITCFVTSNNQILTGLYSSFNWMKDGRNFSGYLPTEVFTSDTTTNTTSIIEFPSLQLNNSGLYECVASHTEPAIPALPLKDSISLNVLGKQFVITPNLLHNH